MRCRYVSLPPPGGGPVSRQNSSKTDRIGGRADIRARIAATYARSVSGARFAGPRATDRFARQATLARSLRLLGEFRFEQGDPARFYGALADDTVALVTSLWTSLHGA